MRLCACVLLALLGTCCDARHVVSPTEISQRCTPFLPPPLDITFTACVGACHRGKGPVSGATRCRHCKCKDCSECNPRVAQERSRIVNHSLESDRALRRRRRATAKKAALTRKRRQDKRAERAFLTKVSVAMNSTRNKVRAACQPGVEDMQQQQMRSDAAAVPARASVAVLWTTWGHIGAQAAELARSVSSVARHLPAAARVLWSDDGQCTANLTGCRPLPDGTRALHQGATVAIGGFPPVDGVDWARAWGPLRPGVDADSARALLRELPFRVGRLFLHRLLLPLGVTAAIYLDSDTLVVHADVRRLLEPPAGFEAAGAAFLVGARCSARSLKRVEPFNFSHPLMRIQRRSQQFNSGVLGFPRLSRWRDAFDDGSAAATLSSLLAARERLVVRTAVAIGRGGGGGGDAGELQDGSVWLHRTTDQMLLQAGYGHLAFQVAGFYNFRPVSGDDATGCEKRRACRAGCLNLLAPGEAAGPKILHGHLKYEDWVRTVGTSICARVEGQIGIQHS